MRQENKEKYGLLVNLPAINIGDEIQAIAARRFLPRVDYFINREELSTFKSEDNEKVKLIMNGWYMHDPSAWPPSEDIVPLLTSMHINPHNQKVAKRFFSTKSCTFFKKNGPVGARDLHTLALLKENGVDSYFSACLTLTLQRNNTKPRKDYILAVDVSEEVIEYIEKQTDRLVIPLNTYLNTEYSLEERFYIAEFFLSMYQNAFCMVTSRLHAALPALAFETPTLLLKDRYKFYDDLRFSGLVELLNSSEVAELLSGKIAFDFNKPLPNRDDYLRYREKLEEKCVQFTGFDGHSKTGYSTYDFVAPTTSPAESVMMRSIQNVFELHEEVESLKCKITVKEQILDSLSVSIRELKESTSWKITAPIRGLKILIQRFLKLNGK